MEIAQIILEFLEIILSPQAIAGMVVALFLVFFKEDIAALFLRIGKIRLPGGTEVSTSQTEKLNEAGENKPLPSAQRKEENRENLPQTLDPQELEEVKQLLDSERARAYLWEYRYLNYFLVWQTHQVLDWFSTLNSPTSVSLFHTIWLPAIPSSNERQNVLSALQGHYLIDITNDLISITPKGQEYIQWRGPLPEKKMT